MGPVFTFLGAVFFGAAAGASGAYLLAVNIARFAFVSLVTKLTAPKIDLQQTAADKLFTTKSSIQPQAFVYGQDLLSGPLIYANVQNDQNLYRIVALTGREIDSFVGFRIDDTDITIGTEIPDDSDTVASGKFTDVVDIDTRRGTSTQTALSAFTGAFPSLWTSAHRARGWSLLGSVMRFKGNSEAFESGIPQNKRALLRGHLVYDPRLDSTQTTIPGTGTHRVDDESTWQWSDNPALCLADWFMWDQVGLGEAPNRIDWDLVAAAADICDELVNIPGPATQKRYTCNFTFFADQSRGSVKEVLDGAMLGRSIFSQGKWRMWAGAPLTATVELDESNLAGGIQLEASTEGRSRYNGVRGKYIDPDRDFQAVAYPPQDDASYLADDNNEAQWRTIDFNACNNTYEAQRNARIELRRSRNQQKIRYDGNWSCFRVQPGAVVNISNTELGYVSKKFFITEWVLDKEGNGVSLFGVEENDSVWTDPLVADYVTRTATGVLTSTGSQGVKISDATIANTREGANCEAGIVLKSNGELKYLLKDGTETSAGVPDDEWRTNLLDYWVRVTEDAGTLDVGTAGTWQSLDADREFSILQSSAGTKTATITVDIASDSAGTTIVASATFELSAVYTVATWTIPEGTFDTGDNAISIGLRFHAGSGNRGSLQPNGGTTIVGPGGGTAGISGTEFFAAGTFHVDEPATSAAFLSDHSVRLSNVTVVMPSGSTQTGLNPDQWYSLSAQRDFLWEPAGSLGTTGDRSLTATVEIRDDTTVPETIVATGVLTIEATRT